MRNHHHVFRRVLALGAALAVLCSTVPSVAAMSDQTLSELEDGGYFVDGDPSLYDDDIPDLYSMMPSAKSIYDTADEPQAGSSASAAAPQVASVDTGISTGVGGYTPRPVVVDMPDDTASSSSGTSKDTTDTSWADDFLFDSAFGVDHTGSDDLYGADIYAANETYYYYNKAFYTTSDHSGNSVSSTMEAFISSQPGATIYMDSVYTVSSTETWAPTTQVTLVHNSTTERALEVQSGGNLTLEGKLVIDGSGAPSTTHTAISIDGGTLTIKDDVKVQNCTATGDAGAIFVTGGGKFNMDGGTLSNNSASLNTYGQASRGGCVLVSSGTFTMTDGTISNNSANYGGGVYVDADGTFTMSGGTISNNTSTGIGGGIYNLGKVVLYNGEIVQNTADSAGAGVAMRGDTFEMYGGQISKNKIETKTSTDSSFTGGGGGVLMEAGVFSFYAGDISENEVTADSCYGGAVMMQCGEFHMYGGSMVGNICPTTAAISGMGGKFIVEGGTIADNGTGVTIRTRSTPITISGGTITQIDDVYGSEDHDGKGHFENVKNQYGAVLAKTANKYGLKVSIGMAGALVTSSDITIYKKDVNGNDVEDTDYEYSFNDVYSDSEGNIYLWLPEGYTAKYRYAGQTMTAKAKIQRCDQDKTTAQYTYTDVGASTVVGTLLRAALEAEPSTTTSQSYGVATLATDITTTTTTYEWRVASTRDGFDVNDVPVCTSRYYKPTGDDMVGKWVRVTITKTSITTTIASDGTVTTTKGTTTTYPSDPVKLTALQLSITVPTTLTVTVNPNGNCTLQSAGSQTVDSDDIAAGDVQYYAAATTTAENTSTIINNSTVPIYLTSVTFTWNTGEGTGTDETGATVTTPAPKDIFTNFNSKQPEVGLTVGTKLCTPTTPTTTSTRWMPDAADGVIGAGDSLALEWTFNLNTNAISTALQAGQTASIGTIVYTVSATNPNATTSQDYDDLLPDDDDDAIVSAGAQPVVVAFNGREEGDAS